MAGRGAAPKRPEHRRNTAVPRAGEWVELQPLERPVLPPLPADEAWSPRTRAAYEVWRSDPATGMYGPAQIQLALDLAYLYEMWVIEPTVALAGEVRQRQDSLGLTPKGLQDRRWFHAAVPASSPGTPDAAAAASKPRSVSASRRARLSVVPSSDAG